MIGPEIRIRSINSNVEIKKYFIFLFIDGKDRDLFDTINPRWPIMFIKIQPRVLKSLDDDDDSYTSCCFWTSGYLSHNFTITQFFAS